MTRNWWTRLRVFFVLTFSLLLFATHTTDAFAQGVPNDTPQTAEVIPSVPFLTTITDTSLATTGTEILCPFFSNSLTNGVWYRYTAPENLSLIADTRGSDFDTILAVAEGTPGSLSEVDCNDDLELAYIRDSEVRFDMQAGETRYFHAGGRAER